MAFIRKLFAGNQGTETQKPQENAAIVDDWVDLGTQNDVAKLSASTLTTNNSAVNQPPASANADNAAPIKAQVTPSTASAPSATTLTAPAPSASTATHSKAKPKIKRTTRPSDDQEPGAAPINPSRKNKSGTKNANKASSASIATKLQQFATPEGVPTNVPTPPAASVVEQERQEGVSASVSAPITPPSEQKPPTDTKKFSCHLKPIITPSGLHIVHNAWLPLFAHAHSAGQPPPLSSMGEPTHKINGMGHGKSNHT